MYLTKEKNEFVYIEKKSRRIDIRKILRRKFFNYV